MYKNTSMALYQWITKVGEDNLYDAIGNRLKNTDFTIDTAATTSMQISAVYTPKEIVRYWSGVRMLATWINPISRTIRIEVRSDEPMLRASTHCERSAQELMKVFPSIY
jgi:hypothetical protein